MGNFKTHYDLRENKFKKLSLFIFYHYHRYKFGESRGKSAMLRMFHLACRDRRLRSIGRAFERPELRFGPDEGAYFDGYRFSG